MGRYRFSEGGQGFDPARWRTGDNVRCGSLFYLSGEDPCFCKRWVNQYPACLSGGSQSPTEINAPRGCAGIRDFSRWIRAQSDILERTSALRPLGMDLQDYNNSAKIPYKYHMQNMTTPRIPKAQDLSVDRIVDSVYKSKMVHMDVIGINMVSDLHNNIMLNWIFCLWPVIHKILA